MAIIFGLAGLTDKEIDHYQKIVVALNETMRTMKDIDELIKKYGGWPDAFHNASSKL